ncbi:MAG: hypothetical protein U9O98_06665 [Asgard group archaeon]|nr:hypothetical protein [Asgard group archaeon]
MGYFKGFLTSLGITYPSFIFIHIFLDPYGEGFTVGEFFATTFQGEWIRLLEVCETAIMEPINIFFAPPNALRITLAFAPWLVTTFIVNFFFKEKRGARGGLSTILFVYLTIVLSFFFTIQEGVLTVDLLKEPNPLYGYLVLNFITLIFGLLFAFISPFKKEAAEIQEGEIEEAEPYYMPESSPSRQNYMERNHEEVSFSSNLFSTSTPPSNINPSTSTSSSSSSSRPKICIYCGSYLDDESDYCTVCGSRID